MPAPFVGLLAPLRSHDFVGNMSRSAHACDAYPGISYRLWRSSRIHRTVYLSLASLLVTLSFLFMISIEAADLVLLSTYPARVLVPILTQI